MKKKKVMKLAVLASAVTALVVSIVNDKKIMINKL